MAACSSVFLFTLVALVLKESAAVVNSSNDSALLLPTETYRPVDMSSADWAKRIWQTVAATTLSSLHCADHCSRRNDTACNMYVYEPSGPTCYLGNIQEEYDHLPTAPVAPDAKVGVNMDAIGSGGDSDGFQLASPVQASWTQYMFSVTPGAASSSVCSFNCISSPFCDMYAWDGNNCFLGNKSYSAGTGVPDGPLDEIWSLEGFLTHEKAVSPGADNAAWAGRVYSQQLVNSGANLSLTCSFACALDANCQFHAVYSSSCYLGNLGLPPNGTLLAPGAGAFDVTVHYGKLPSDVLQPENTFRYVSSDAQSYKSFGSDDVGHCMAACFMEPPGQCHFYVVKHDTCYLGHFSNLTYSANERGINTYHFITANVVNNGVSRMPVHYQEMTMPASGWRAQTYDTWETDDLLALSISTKDECLSIGLFSEDWAFVVYYDGLCYGGTFMEKNRNVGQKAFPPDGTVQTVYIKPIEHIDSIADGSLILPSLQPPSDALTMIYKTVAVADIPEPPDDEGFYETRHRCHYACMMEGHSFCSGAILDPAAGSCHLTTETEDDIGLGVTLDPTLEWDVKRPKLGVILGGLDDPASPTGVVPGMELVRHKENLCEVPDGTVAIPDPGLGVYGAPMAYVGSKLLIAGGWDFVSDVPTSGGIVLDLDKTSYDWVPTGSGMNRPRAFHQLLPYRDPVGPDDDVFDSVSNAPGKAAAVGGVATGAPAQCPTVMETYDASADTWSDLVGPVFQERQKGCAVEHRGKFYIAGGLNCDGTAVLNTLEIFDVATGAVTAGPTMTMGRHSLACTITYHRLVGFHLVTAGGVLLDGTLTSKMEILQLDDMSTGWTSDHIDEGSMGYFGSSSSALFLNNTLYDGSNLLPGNMATIRRWSMMPYWFDTYRALGLDHLSNFRIWPSQAAVPLHKVWHCIPDDEWVTLLRQEAPNTFGAAQWSANPTAAEPRTATLFSVMDQVENFRTCDGRFHFRLVWPELPFFNEWWQTSNPTTSATVTGYQTRRLGFPTDFGGLRLVDDTDLLMTGDAGANPGFPFGVGHKGAALTGPMDSSTSTVRGVAVVELRVRPDFCW